MSKEELVDLWKGRLEQFLIAGEVVKGMDPGVAMGVQHARTITLKQCIKELEFVISFESNCDAVK